MSKITNKDCTYLLLCKLPNGDIHQVIIDQELIKQAITESGKFMLQETVLENIDFYHPKEENNGKSS